VTETPAISERIKVIRVEQSKLVPEEFSTLLNTSIMCIDPAVALIERQVIELRAGVAASAEQPEETLRALDFLLANRDQLARGAKKLADQYCDFNPSRQIDALIHRLEAQLA
jgi:hypothetical protein